MTDASIRRSLKRLSPKGWAMVGGSVAAVLVFLVVLMQMASAPSYATLETGLDPSQTGKITSTLATQGIAYQLQNNGTALAVQSDKTAQARVALATAGLLGTQQPGFSLMDKQQLGQSNFQQQVTYERALEGQLASTIETIDGVSSAQVNLVLPNAQDQLFADQQQPSTASVLLSGSSTLQSSSVRGIAQLVASSVPGLQAGKVTITGADGSLLWPTATARRRRSRRAARPAGRRASTTTRDGRRGQRDARPDARRRQGPGVVNADVNANQATAQSAGLRQEGRAADPADRPPRRSRAPAPPAPAASRARGQHPGLRVREPATAAAATPTTRTRRPTPRTASTRRSPTR